MGNQAKPPRSFNTIRHSQTQARAKRRRQERVVLLSILAVIALILLSLLIFGICAIADVIASNAPPADTGTPSGNGNNNSNPPQVAVLYNEQVTRTASDTYYGELILVNEQHKYQFPANLLLTNIADERSKINGTNFYQINADILQSTNRPRVEEMESTAFEAFEAMMQKHYDISGGETSVRIRDAYRTLLAQEDFGVDPGYSDHHTGYCIALDYANTKQPLESSHWILKNCYKYGFIVRYPDTKSEITGIDKGYEYCLRYVGVAHATYITNSGLCMEEYIELLQNNYSADNHLKITGADGNSYEVYYVPASAGSELTTITVPSNYEYTISGDNDGGFIVTVNLSAPKA